MRYLFKPFLISLLLVFATTGFFASSASAHGEKSQAAFMRMRTIYWFDLNWSKEVLPVNDTMTISGKFFIFSGWPETVDKPEISFLNIGIPGPVFIRVGSWIGGQLVPRSVSLELGETYEFKVLLKARRPGDWHVHIMMNVKGGGPIIGPGKWVTITGSMASFTNPITTTTGETIDLETYNLGNTYFWHALWYGLGLLWVAYWVRKPLFVPRLIAVEAGKADSLITATDKKVALWFAAVTLAIVAASMVITNEQYPVTIPLQAGLLRGIKSIEMPPSTVSVKIEDASYRVPDRAMQMTLAVTNNGDSAVRLGEFNTAGVRFLDAAVAQDETGYPDDLLAEEGLTVSDNSPLAPGQTRTIEVTASDAALEDYRLSDIIYDPDSRLAGLLFFFGADDGRQIVQVDAPLIPSFVSIALTPPTAKSGMLNYTNVRVFFATDRNRTKSKHPDEMFGADRSSSLSYGICEVSIPLSPFHTTGELESPHQILIPQLSPILIIWKLKFPEDPAKHVVLQKVEVKSKDEFFSDIAASVRASGSQSAFLFVHGYNVSFKDAARRTAQISIDLDFKGAPVFYSWPSQGKLIFDTEGMRLAYPADHRNSELTQTNLKRFLEDFFARSHAKSVYLIAHSMGSEALTNAVTDLLAKKPNLRQRLKEVILAAPDIDAAKFKQIIAPALADSITSTLYASSNDCALYWSKKINGYARAGDSGLGIIKGVPGIEAIDASDIDDTGLLGGCEPSHSYFAENRSVLSDISYLIDGLRADQRHGLQGVDTPEGRYWVFKK